MNGQDWAFIVSIITNALLPIILIVIKRKKPKPDLQVLIIKKREEIEIKKIELASLEKLLRKQQEQIKSRLE